MKGIERLSHGLGAPSKQAPTVESPVPAFYLSLSKHFVWCGNISLSLSHTHTHAHICAHTQYQTYLEFKLSAKDPSKQSYMLIWLCCSLSPCRCELLTVCGVII